MRAGAANTIVAGAVGVAAPVMAVPLGCATGEPTLWQWRVAPSVGPWNHVEGTLRGERFMALGRASADELLDLIASTLE